METSCFIPPCFSTFHSSVTEVLSHSDGVVNCLNIVD